MAIDPVGSSGIPETSTRRVEPTASEGPGHAAARPAGGDSVDVSAAARELATPDIPLGSIAAEQLRAISERIASGHYNSDAVIDAIATGLGE